MSQKKIKAGIDIGGTNTALGLVDDSGTIISRYEIKTHCEETAEGLIDNICKFIQSYINKNNCEIEGIGIGVPNGNYYKDEIEWATNLRFEMPIPIKKLFNKHFDCPIIISNDANTAALGELYYGGAIGMTDFITLTLGTGVGSGIVSNGKLLLGKHGNAGEIGHAITIPNGRKCSCGRKGCLETYASIRGIIYTAKELMEKHPNSGLHKLRFINPYTICQLAMEGDIAAIKTYDYTALVISIQLANSIAHFDPEAIFLFGGPTKCDDLLIKPLKKYLDRYLLHIYKNENIIIQNTSLDSNNAAILGAAALINYQHLKY